MSQLDELSNYFYQKGLTFTRAEISTLVSNIVSSGLTSTVPADNPGVPSAPVVKLAVTPGTYANYLSAASTPITIVEKEVGFLTYNITTGYWSKQSINVAVDLSGYTQTSVFTPYKAITDVLQMLVSQGPTAGLSIADPAGNAIMVTLPDGTIKFIEILTQLITASSLATNQVDLGVVLAKTTAGDIVFADSSGNIAFKITTDGKLIFDYADILKLVRTNIGLTAEKQVNGYLADVNHYLIYGQSLSIGGNTQSSVTASLTQPYNSLMFNSGLKPNNQSDPSLRYTSLVPMVSDGLVETPAPGAANEIVSYIQSADGHAYNDAGWQYQVLISCDGQTGTAIAGLSKGTTVYQRIIDSVTAGLALSIAAGKTYNVPSVIWIQGEQDAGTGTAPATYRAAMIQLKKDLNADIKAITGQVNDIPIICYQTSSHNATTAGKDPSIALVQLDLALNEPGFEMAAPTYMLDYQSDNIHLINTSSLVLGAYCGLAAYRKVVKGAYKNFLYPLSAIRQGSIIEVLFKVPVAPLVFDTTLVTDPGNYGFRVFDNTNTEMTISSVAIIRGNTVKIVCSAAIPAGSKLTYAINGTTTGRTSGSRGNLRDSQGTLTKYSNAGFTYDLNNYCPIFSLNL